MSLNDLPRGQLSTIILSVLTEGDKYGYEILSEIKEKSNGTLIIKQPSLYSALSRMEKQGYITSYWQDGNIGGRRHYYSLSDLGKNHVEHLDQVFISEKEEPSLNISNLKSKELSTSENKSTISNESYISSDNDSPVKINNDLPHQSSFLNSSILKIRSDKLANEKPDNEMVNQLNIFDKNIDLTTKKFNINAEINLCKPANQSFAEIVKGNSSKILSVSSDKKITEKSNNNSDIIDSPKIADNNMHNNSIENTPNIDVFRLSADNEKQINEIESGIFITEKYKSEEMPKVRKINPLRLNDDNEKESLKLKPNPEYGHTEMINELYKKSSTVKNKNSLSSSAPTFEELKNYYEGINVKFSTYKTQDTEQSAHKSPLNYIDHYKASLKKFLILFVLISLESLSCYLIFNYLDLPIIYSELYIIIPAIFLIKPIYCGLMVLTKKSKIITEIKISPIWIDLLIIIVGITLIYSINMLLGLTYLNISEYATTFIYPSILLLNLIAIYILNTMIYKKISLKK
ncbi:MAG: PadR family transcriptional regulator [Clostridia bacterium]|nr:PadR family transcriptional regulator [Clostridia bacterium]